MVPWMFDLSSAHGLADFVEYHVLFLPGEHPRAGLRRFDEHEVESLRKSQLLTQAREIGKATWSSRQALREFLEGDGQVHQRELLLDMVRPATAVLLARFFARYPDVHIRAIFDHAEAPFVFHEPERVEISLVIPEVWVKLWNKYSSSLLSARRGFDKELAFFCERLEEERNKDEDVTHEQLSRLQDLEDRVFLKGERVDMDVMGWL